MDPMVNMNSGRLDDVLDKDLSLEMDGRCAQDVGILTGMFIYRAHKPLHG